MGYPERTFAGVETWLQNEDLFRQLVKEGHSWQEYAAKLLQDAGYHVHVPPLTIRDDVADRGKWLDTKDILIEGFPFEVKSRKIHFTCPDDFPFPDIIVDTVRGYTAKNQKPLAYLYVSQETGQMIWTWGRRPSDWTQRPIKDLTRNIVDLFYLAPKGIWRPIADLHPVLTALKSIHTADLHAMAVSGKE